MLQSPHCGGRREYGRGRIISDYNAALIKKKRSQTENQEIGIAINKIVNKNIKSVNWTPG